MLQELIFRLPTALMILGGVNSVRCITGLDLALKTNLTTTFPLFLNCKLIQLGKLLKEYYLNVRKNNRYQLCDYLTTTGIYDFIFQGSLPKEAPPFKSLWLPFDHMTWALVLISFISVSFSLYAIERRWSSFKSMPLKNDGKLMRSRGYHYEF